MVRPFRGSSGRLPSRVEYLSPQGVLLPRVYDTTASDAVARVAGPRCSVDDPFPNCVPARLSLVASMAPDDVCNVPGCRLAGFGPAALGYRPCCWVGWLAWSPECV